MDLFTIFLLLSFNRSSAVQCLMLQVFGNKIKRDDLATLPPNVHFIVSIAWLFSRAQVDDVIGGLSLMIPEKESFYARLLIKKSQIKEKICPSSVERLDKRQWTIFGPNQRFLCADKVIIKTMAGLYLQMLPK